MLELAALYLAAINAAAVTAFWLDKRAAERGGWRVPERRLLILAALGGSPGAIAARVLLRHKTRKTGFGAALSAIAAVHAFDAQQRLGLAGAIGRAGADLGQQLFVQVELPGMQIVDLQHVGGFQGFDQVAVGCAHGRFDHPLIQ